MAVTYIFGHKKPDTDAVCSSIVLSYLKNILGEKTESCILGTINKETEFVLKKFGFQQPKFLNDVKVQIKDMNFNKKALTDEDATILEAFKKMHDLGVTGLPLVKNKILSGYVNLKDIANYGVNYITKIDTSYENIINLLNGKSILKFNDEIKGTIDENIAITNNKEVESILNNKPFLLIITNSIRLSKEDLALAKKNKVSIIETSLTLLNTINIIKFVNPARIINNNKEPIKFYLDDERTDFIEMTNKFGHTNYPIVNRKNECLGMIRLVDINNYQKKKVILVDHNQKDQTVDGIDEAEILEIIDHHNLGIIGTNSPISFRTMPVGCTNTILYQLFKENHVKIPKNIAGLMASAIISDTLLFKSPTTTALDKETCLELCKIASLDANIYGMEMFKAGFSISDMNKKEIFNQDFKTYKTSNGDNLVISQFFTVDYESVLSEKEEFVSVLDEMHDIYNYKVALLFVTDILGNASYLFYNTEAESLVSESYNIESISEGYFMPNVVSRKKQMLPPLLECLERKK